MIWLFGYLMSLAVRILFCEKSQIHTCAVQMLYWVNMASYKAIRPLCPAAAHALASKTGTD